MTNMDVHAAIAAGTLLFDGATGTYAKTREGWPQGPVELACLSAPHQVEALHRAYLAAGCGAIKTNTFAAHPGLAVADEAMQRDVVRAAVRVANAAAGEDAFVFADIGPAPLDQEAAYIRMAQLFLDEGISCFLMETMPDAAGIREAAAYIKACCPHAFVAVSFACDPDGFTRSGELASELIGEMDRCADVDAVGLNCICGAYHMRRLIAGLPEIQKPLITMPNAGYPHMIDGRTYYDSDPQYYAQQVAACVSLGARIAGGCCGTTPEHIRCLVQELSRQDDRAGAQGAAQADREKPCRSAVKKKLDQGRRVILVELDPPKDAGTDAFLSGAKQLAACGADAVTIADCPIGRARMDSSLLACKIRRELGIEALPHMTCRDRNVNATKALLLGLSMEDVHNVLVVTGDPVPTEDRGSVKGVFQFNSRVLARFVRSLSKTGEAEPFFLCGALNVNAVNFDSELERAKDKEACGVEAFLTQPVLSEYAALNIERARKELGAKIIGGIFPVVSHKNACFLSSEVAGITLDEAVVRAYEGLDRQQAEELALRLCEDAARRIAPYVDGFYIMTPFQRVALVCRVMERLRAL